MKLAEVFNLDTLVVLVGVPEPTIHKSSEGEIYYVCNLAKPARVSCSIDKNIIAHETEEVYVRESALNNEGWEYVDAAKPELGYFMPKWKIDFSKGQELPIYQETTIAEWRKNKNAVDGKENLDRTNEGIMNRMKLRKAALEGIK